MSLRLDAVKYGHDRGFCRRLDADQLAPRELVDPAGDNELRRLLVFLLTCILLLLHDGLELLGEDGRAHAKVPGGLLDDLARRDRVGPPELGSDRCQSLGQQVGRGIRRDVPEALD